MSKVTIIQAVYNNIKYIPAVFPAILNQTFKDLEVVAVICGNEDGSKEMIAKNFPTVKIIDPGENLGFAKAHNLIFRQSRSEFFQLVNPDLIMEPDYVEKMLEVFKDPRVGAATGKLLKYDFEKNQKTNLIDSTGVVIFKSGAARDRGQHEIDKGQYDKFLDIPAVSGAGCMYRASSLQATSYKLEANKEFFDEDFHSYWEDVDLAWRMTVAGWKCKYQPAAVAYHGRGAGSHNRGYKDVLGYIKHHKTLNPLILQFNYRNHIFMYLKNSPWFYPQFFIREFFMLGYIILLEQGTLKILPEIIKLFPKMWRKRKLIRQLHSITTL